MRLSRLIATMGILSSLLSVGAEVTLLPDRSLRVTVSAPAPPLIAVDYSTNLLDWAELTSLQTTDGAIVIPPSISPSTTAFFRLSDANETFLIRGVVAPFAHTPSYWLPGCDHCGGGTLVTADPTPLGLWPGANIFIPSSGEFAIADQEGRFHFNRRFTRSDLPLDILSSIPGFASATNSLTRDFVGEPVETTPILVMTEAANIWVAQGMDWYPSVYRFHFRTGPDRGRDLVAKFYNVDFTFEGVLNLSGGASLIGFPDRLGPTYWDPSQAKGGGAIYIWGNEETGPFFSMSYPASGEVVNGLFSSKPIELSRAPWFLSEINFNFTHPPSLLGSNVTVTIDQPADGHFILSGSGMDHGTYDYYAGGVNPLFLSGTTGGYQFHLFFQSPSDASTNDFFMEFDDGANFLSASGVFTYRERPRLPPPTSLSFIACTLLDMGSPWRDLSLAFDTETTGTFWYQDFMGQFSYRIDGSKAFVHGDGNDFSQLDLELDFYFPADSTRGNHFTGRINSVTTYDIEGIFTYAVP